MKTLIHSVKNLPRSFANPLNHAALPLFFALAFLPCIMRLTFQDFSIFNPFVTLGPVIAAFWLAAGLREIRVNYAVIGIIVTALFWSANWIMISGDQCCATMMGVH